MGQFGLCSLAVITLLGVVTQAPSSASLAVMSVDLGLEWLKIAIVKPGVPMEIVLNKESRRKTPVVVALKDGELQISDPALSTSTRYPKSAYFYLQDLLAKSIDSPMVQTYKKRFPFYNLVEDEERGTVVFQHDDETKYSPEELLAIILNKSREIAADFAEQPINDIVITVPPYFNQAERKSILQAAELAGLKVLQLMNANTAVALNYGVFRRADFNSTPTNIMFYDMGAGSTIATIVSYQIAKIKEKGVAEINPQLVVKGVGKNTSETIETVPPPKPKHGRRSRDPTLEIKGVGFDRTLGGLEMEFRLRDHLAKLFTDQKKTKSSVYDSPRSMAKLFKEAKRVKKVLSANNDHFSQIEGLLDDKDFTATKVTRAQLEEMNKDLIERIEGPIKDALKMSEMTMQEIDQVILVGGGTRVPKVQEMLLKATGKKELGKNINADEAAALGAVYQAAHLGKGFKVKKFVIKDANIFPIQVSFQRTIFGDDGEEDGIKTVKRTLFGHGNPFPQKKVMTFNRHTGDFNFNVGYNDLENILNEDDIKNFGVQNLTTYTLTGVADAISKNSDSESKGIKAHFRMDDSGILHLDNVESVFEKTEQVMEEVNETDGQSTFANPMWKGFEELSSTITSFFSGGKGDEEDQEGDIKTEEPAGDAETEQGEEGTTDDASLPQDQDDKPTSDESSEESKEEKSDEEATEEESTGDVDAKDEEEAVEKAEADEDKEEPKADTDSQETTEDKPSNNEDKTKEDASENEEKTDGDEKTEEDKKSEDGDKTSDDQEDDGSDKKEKKKEKKKVAKPKVVSKKVNITVEVENLDIPAPSKDSKKESRNKLKELKKREDAKKDREIALNNLESFIYETKDKLYDETWQECSVEEEREQIQTSFSEASDWLDELPFDSEAKVYKDKMKELKKIVKDLKFRVKEKKELPEIIVAMKESFNYSHHFLAAAKNLSEADQIFSEVEIKTLTDVYNETLEWFKTKSTEQEGVPCTHDPVMLTADVKEKYMKLDRELQYLYNKAKSQPKKKKPKKTKTKKSNETETTENGDGEDKEDKTKTDGEEAETTEQEKTDGDTPTEETITETQEEAPSEKKGEEEKKEEEPEEVLQLEAAEDSQAQNSDATEEEQVLNDLLKEKKKDTKKSSESKSSSSDSKSSSKNKKGKPKKKNKNKNNKKTDSNSHNTGEL